MTLSKLRGAATRYSFANASAERKSLIVNQRAKQSRHTCSGLTPRQAFFRAADPLWLDLQRYVCAALRGLGATHEKAYEVVVTETAGLVRRLGEGMFDLKFKTGQPSAPAWIATAWSD